MFNLTRDLCFLTTFIICGLFVLPRQIASLESVQKSDGVIIESSDFKDDAISSDEFVILSEHIIHMNERVNVLEAQVKELMSRANNSEPKVRTENKTASPQMDIRVDSDKGQLLTASSVYTYVPHNVKSWNNARAYCMSNGFGDLLEVNCHKELENLTAAFTVWKEHFSTREEFYVMSINIVDHGARISNKRIGSNCPILSIWNRDLDWYDYSGHLESFSKPCYESYNRGFFCEKKRQ